MYLNNYSVLVVSDTVDPAEAMVSGLENCSSRNARLITKYIAFNELNTDSAISEWINNNTPDAVILLLAKEGLNNPLYRKWVEWSIHRVSSKDDFRLFVFLQNMSMDTFNALCDKDSYVTPEDSDYHQVKLLYNLRDTVQINETTDKSELLNDVMTYLNKIPRIKEQARFRILKLQFSLNLGRMAAFIQILSASFVILCTLAALIRGKAWMTGILSGIPVPLISIFSALLYAPLLSVPFYLFLRGTGITNMMLGKNKRLGWMTAICVFLGTSTTGIPGEVGAPTSWIILGIASGIVLDVLRRNGRQAKREKFSLKEDVATLPDHTLPKEILQVNDNYMSNPLHCPYLSENKAKVFISYTHSSDWAQNVVDDLRTELLKAGADCFLDKRDINNGSSWRRRLHQKMADANVFISITDNRSISKDKKWPAAEMETALAGKYYTGLPEMLMLVPEGFSKKSDDNNMPVYNAIFNSTANMSDEMMRIIEVKENTIRMVASAYRLYSFHTTSVIHPLISGMAAFMKQITGIVGPFCTIFGYIALVISILDYRGKIDINTMLASGAFHSPLFLLLCFWAGFNARLVISSWYELNAENSKSVAKVNFVSFCGLAALIVQLSGGIPQIIAGWAAVVGVMGLASAKEFVFTVAKVKKEFMRADI